MFQLFICSLSFATFTVHDEKPQNRLQLSFTLVLTTIAFKFTANQSLPKISYLTYLVCHTYSIHLFIRIYIAHFPFSCLEPCPSSNTLAWLSKGLRFNPSCYQNHKVKNRAFNILRVCLLWLGYHVSRWSHVYRERHPVACKIPQGACR